MSLYAKYILELLIFHKFAYVHLVHREVKELTKVVYETMSNKT